MTGGGRPPDDAAASPPPPAAKARSRPEPEYGTMNAAEVIMFLGLHLLWLGPRRLGRWLAAHVAGGGGGGSSPGDRGL